MREFTLFVVLWLVALSWPQAQTPQDIDHRVCYADLTQIPRNADGSIKRSTTQKALFVKRWPCPSTGQVSGACPGWQVNHTIPLANGGCDIPSNMDWMPTAIKTCAADYCRDRWERKVYANPQVLVPSTW